MNNSYVPLLLFMIPIVWLIALALLVEYPMVGIVLYIISMLVVFFLALKYIMSKIKLKKWFNKSNISSENYELEQKYNEIFKKYILPLEPSRKKCKFLTIVLNVALISMSVVIFLGIYIVLYTPIGYVELLLTLFICFVIYWWLSDEKWKKPYINNFKDDVLANFLYSLNKGIRYKHEVRKGSHEDVKNVTRICKDADLWSHKASARITIDTEIDWKLNEEKSFKLFDILLHMVRYRFGRRRRGQIMFKGLLGWTDLDNYVIESSIRIAPKLRFDGRGTEVTMNNSRFESVMAVHCRDSLLAASIVTNKLMNCIANLYEESGLDFFITIKGKNIYYEFFTGSQTYVNKQKNLHKRQLYCYYYAIKMMEETSIIINESIRSALEQGKLRNISKYFDEY